MMMSIKHCYFGDYRVLGTVLDMKFQNREDLNMLKKNVDPVGRVAFSNPTIQ